MFLPSIAIVLGLILLVWSADRFIEGSASIAQHFNIPPLLIGMVIVGFGTSAPELMVSVVSAIQDKPDIALGNAYGSNITNIALVLGLTALISPIAVHSSVLRKELPILIGITGLTIWLLWDESLTRIESFGLLLVFCILLGWNIWEGIKKKADSFGSEIEEVLQLRTILIPRALFWLITGLIMLVVSSQMLVWGAVKIAHIFAVSELIIGLTIVATGTSLPELASSMIAAYKGKHDIALGNILGSNLFNTLAVVGLAGTISPMAVKPEILSRDILVMSTLTVFLFIISYGFRRPGRINRLEGFILLTCYLSYAGYLIYKAF